MHLVREIIALLRVHQWFRNTVLALPLLSIEPGAWSSHVPVLIAAVLAFSLLSASVYALNDICDSESDRWHPDKSSRPLARGSLSHAFAGILAAVFAACGLYVCFGLSASLGGIALCHLGLGISYSLRLKHVPWVDVTTISAGFALRLYAGASLVAGITTQETAALAGVCAGGAGVFALLKRRDELLAGVEVAHRPTLKHFSIRRLEQAAGVTIAVTALIGATALAAATWVFALHVLVSAACAWRAIALTRTDGPAAVRMQRDRWLAAGALLYGLLWLA